MSLTLHELGWNPFFENQRTLRAPGPVARISAEHRGAYEVWSEAGIGRARLAGRLRHRSAESSLPCVGDWVVLDDPPGPERTAVIEDTYERRTVFTRGASGREARAQVIAANVDLVFVLCALDGDFSLHRIERYLARIRASGAAPAVILSKADVVEDPQTWRAEVARRAPGVPVHVLSSHRGDGLAGILAQLDVGLTVALVGSSGVGKSTLANALLGEERMTTAAVREDGTGRHATTHRQLMVLPGGGLLLDTPGMRELQLLDDAGLGQAFEDILALARTCRFGDCLHGAEPGCGVRAAIEDGRLEPDRLSHFLQLEQEARAYQRRHDARLRRIDERKWGKLAKEVHRQIRRKRGEE